MAPVREGFSLPSGAPCRERFFIHPTQQKGSNMRTCITQALIIVCSLSISFALQAQTQGRRTEKPRAEVNQNKRIAVQPLSGPVDPTPGYVPLYAKAGKNVGSNVMVNIPQTAFPYGRSETSIATDPSGSYLVAGWNDAEGFCGAPFGAPCPPPPVPGLSGYGWSTNGGASWTDGGTPWPLAVGSATWITRGDPYWDNGGAGQKIFYMSNMTVPMVDPSGLLTGLLVHRGKFGTSGFAFDQATLIPPTNNGYDGYDKDCVAAGKTASTKDMVCVGATNFIGLAGNPQWGDGQIEVYTSSDRAFSFPKRAIVQPDETNPDFSGTVDQGSSVAIAGNGKIYCAWERGWLAPYTGSNVWPQIVIARSDDGGATFGPRTLVSDISSGSFYPPAGYNRPTSNDFPRIAVATGEGDPYYGRVYAAYHDSRIANGGPQSVVNNDGNGNTDIYLRYSTDEGTSWSSAVLIAGGPSAQFWPCVSVQPDGTVDVVWYDNNGGITDVYYAASTDGGATFSAPVKVTSAPTDWTTVTANMHPNFGDYIGVASRQNRAFACWGDGRPDAHPNVFAAAIAWGTPKQDRNGLLPATAELRQNYPNPFNPSTTISYSLADAGRVSLKVYNALGAEVASLVNTEQSAGAHTIAFDASRLPGGAYKYVLRAGGFTATKTMVLVK